MVMFRYLGYRCLRLGKVMLRFWVRDALVIRLELVMYRY